MQVKATVCIITKNNKTLGRTLASLEANTTKPYEVLIINGGDKLDCGYPVIDCSGGTINKDIKEAFPKIPTELFTVVGADFVFGSNWLSKAIYSFITLFPEGIGVLALNDGIWDGKKATVVLTSKRTVTEYLNGELYDTRFMHYRCDTLLTYLATKKGIYGYCPESKAVHIHTPDPCEENRCWEHDKALYDKIVSEYENSSNS